MKHSNVALFVPHLGCPHRCAFCNQESIAGQAAPPTGEEVSRTAREALSHLGAAAGEAEIAFFGGSFTAIERETMVSLLEAAAPFVGPGMFRGIRISTRPDAIDEPVLSLLRNYGVTAIELGAQSMDDEVLKKNNRGHTARDVAEASERIKKGGFELGLQMMTGLYGDSPQGSLRTAERIAALSPRTVRIYPTIVVKGTRLEELYRCGAYVPQTLGEAVDLCTRLLAYFLKKGIRVIRLGLHAEKSLEEAYVAGPMHPAFRELCENRIYLAKAREALRGISGPAALGVNRASVSKLAGQHRSNILTLERELGARIKIIGMNSVPEYEVALLTESKGTDSKEARSLEG